MTLKYWQPIGSLILIDKIEEELGKESGTRMLDSQKAPPTTATIKILGTGWVDPTGHKIPFHVEPKDTVLIIPFNTRRINLETVGMVGDLYLIAHTDILAVQRTAEDGSKYWEAINNYILVDPFPKNEASSSGVIKPHNMVEAQKWGEVLSVGPGLPDMAGEIIPPPMEVGDAVATEAHGREFTAPVNIIDEDSTQYFVSEYDVLLKAKIA